MNGTLTPIQRFFLAFVAFFYVLMNRRFAEEVYQVRERSRLALPPPEPSVNEATAAAAPAPQEQPAPAVAPAPPEQPAPTAAAAPPEQPAPAAAPVPTPEPVPTPPPAAASPAAPEHAEALHVLSLLQRDGRLIDFLSESLEGFSDSEIGAAARTVHAGCRKALDAYLDLEPVFGEGEPPFKGSLRHHGWRATRAAFPPPPAAQDPRILAPAEVEL
jgi:hypothetical protein